MDRKEIEEVVRAELVRSRSQARVYVNLPTVRGGYGIKTYSRVPVIGELIKVDGLGVGQHEPPYAPYRTARVEDVEIGAGQDEESGLDYDAIVVARPWDRA